MRYPPIILASQSPRRAALLQQIGVPFRAAPTGADETPPTGASPELTAETLAMRKADAAADALGGNWGDSVLVLGADTIVCLGGALLGKPHDAGEAAQMLESLSGTVHHVITGAALVWKSGHAESWHEITRVAFRKLSREEIRAYAESGEPLDKAGGYGIQGRAAAFAARIEGCYFNVVGLPLAKLTQKLLNPPMNLP